MALTLAEKLILTLPPSRPGLYNPWRDACPYDHATNSPAARIERLNQHFDCRPRFVLIGEAPGYQGARYSGVAFTSEKLLIEGSIPRIEPLHRPLSTKERPFSEPSATIVWKTLYRLGIAEETLLWNAVQMHPHKLRMPWSNRTPRPDELSLGLDALQLLVDAFPETQFVAVGAKAELALNQLKIPYQGRVRHPANGGATLFAEQLELLVRASKTGAKV